jgi:CBS-domain-containing membrane protein
VLLVRPFDTFVTLIYGLYSVPTLQPRNVVLGQALSGAVAMFFNYVPEELLPVWIRRAVAPAFGIAAMAKCRVPHPPAGAHSNIYAGGQYDWTLYGFVVLGAAIYMHPVVLINDLSERRQYPWGYWTQ